MSNYLKRGDNIKLSFYSDFGKATAYISAPDSYGAVTVRSDFNEHTSFTIQ